MADITELGELGRYAAIPGDRFGTNRFPGFIGGGVGEDGNLTARPTLTRGSLQPDGTRPVAGSGIEDVLDVDVPRPGEIGGPPDPGGEGDGFSPEGAGSNGPFSDPGELAWGNPDYGNLGFNAGPLAPGFNPNGGGLTFAPQDPNAPSIDFRGRSSWSDPDGEGISHPSSSGGRGADPRSQTGWDDPSNPANGGSSGGGSGGSGASSGHGDASAAGGESNNTNGSFAIGGMVTADRLGGPDPVGPDDGAANLDIGEYVNNRQSVQTYGRDIFDLLNASIIPPQEIATLVRRYGGGQAPQQSALAGFKADGPPLTQSPLAGYSS